MRTLRLRKNRLGNSLDTIISLEGGGTMVKLLFVSVTVALALVSGVECCSSVMLYISGSSSYHVIGIVMWGFACLLCAGGALSIARLDSRFW